MRDNQTEFVRRFRAMLVWQSSAQLSEALANAPVEGRRTSLAGPLAVGWLCGLTELEHWFVHWVAHWFF